MSALRRLFVALPLALAATAFLSACSAETDEPLSEDTSEDGLILRRGSVDHAAIVEATTMMLVDGFATAAPPLDPSLDPYNQEDPFRIVAATYRASFAKNLARFDDYDRKKDWTAAQATAWANRMATGNYQVVDTQKPCNFASPHTYLEIERAALTGKPHATCGGRMPNEDALDVTVNFLIRGPGATEQDPGAIRDGVFSATKPAVPTFPYLAEMNGL